MLSNPGDRVLHAMTQGLRRGDVFLGNLTTLRARHRVTAALLGRRSD